MRSAYSLARGIAGNSPSRLLLILPFCEGFFSAIATRLSCCEIVVAITALDVSPECRGEVEKSGLTTF